MWQESTCAMAGSDPVERRMRLSRQLYPSKWAYDKVNGISLQDKVSSKIIEAADSSRNGGFRFGGDSLETSHCCKVRETLQFRESAPVHCMISTNVKVRKKNLPFPALQRVPALACKCSRSKCKKTC